MRLLSVIVLLLIQCRPAISQEGRYYRYDNDALPAEFHSGRREAVRQAMPDSSVAILFSNPIRNRSNDVDFQYHQDPDFYYLTGHLQPDAVLILFKEPQMIDGRPANEILFIQPRNPDRETWDGRRLETSQASKLSGISHVYPTNRFDSLNIPFDDFQYVLYTKLPQGAVDNRSTSVDLFDLKSSFEKQASKLRENGDNFKLKRILTELREVKLPVEMRLLQKAVDMTCEAFRAMMPACRPGMTEYQVQAVGEYVFKSNGAEYVGYPSICGAAENSCILHYNTNRRPLAEGDLLLLDMGAEYHGYTADVTRTLPVSGKFTPEQRQVYDLVYQAHQAGIEACKPGNDFLAPHQAALKVIREGLVQLGILQDESEYRRYFMHGTSHYLGLDVHDAGTRGKLKPGSVITVEPGIYIPEGSPCDKKWWNIGIRIEDDILITETGHENLSGSLPAEAEAIESAMTNN